MFYVHINILIYYDIDILIYLIDISNIRYYIYIYCIHIDVIYISPTAQLGQGDLRMAIERDVMTYLA